jgi:hypothetical protein
MNSIQKEFDGLMEDKQESKEILNLELNKFAEEIRNGLGEEIKQELLNPTNQTVKKTHKEKRGERWREFKNKLNAYFFPENNDFDFISNE